MIPPLPPRKNMGISNIDCRYIDIDKAILENIDIDEAILKNIDINRKYLRNIDIDIDKGIIKISI